MKKINDSMTGFGRRLDRGEETVFFCHHLASTGIIVTIIRNPPH